MDKNKEKNKKNNDKSIDKNIEKESGKNAWYDFEPKEMSHVEEGAPAYQTEGPWLYWDNSEKMLDVKKPRVRSYGDKTLEDYLALPEGTRVEMLDGRFYEMAGPTTSHQGVAGYLYQHFWNHIKNHKGTCRAFVSPIDVQVDAEDTRTILQPDVVIVCDRNKITRARIVGAPDLVVEVVSPSNRKWDTMVKKQRYFETGVKEYWIVFPKERKVWVYLFEKDTEPKEYSFDDRIPVTIWNGSCEAAFFEVEDYIFFE